MDNNNNNYNVEKIVEQIEKLWNMKVTVIPIVTGALGTVTKGLI